MTADPAAGARLSPAVPILATARLILSRPTGEDLESIERLAGDWDVAQWLARVPHPYRRADAVFFIEQVVRAEPCWAIRDCHAGDLMGVVGLAPAAATEGPELGYWLGRPFWGNGYATESARAVLDRAFATTDAAVIRSGYLPDNVRSAHVLAKLGFQRTGMSERVSLTRGKTVPHVDVELRRDGWRSRRK